MSSKNWKTAITKIGPNEVAVRGYDIAELMGRASAGQAVYLILRGEAPSAEVGRLMDAILVSSIDHGATPPSALAARTVASTGASLSAAVAAGILSINQHHGGAIEACARTLGEVIAGARAGGSLDEAAERVLAEYKLRTARIAGFGHRVHTADPRTARLFELAAEAGVGAGGADGPSHVEAARALEGAFARGGKALPINVDGAIGAILADLGFEHTVMNGLFMIARVPGLVAHAVEEQTRERAMRKVDPTAHEYDGPARREWRP